MGVQPLGIQLEDIEVLLVLRGLLVPQGVGNVPVGGILAVGSLVVGSPVVGSLVVVGNLVVGNLVVGSLVVVVPQGILLVGSLELDIVVQSMEVAVVDMLGLQPLVVQLLR